MLSFKSSLHILDTNPSSDTCFANIFSEFVAFLPILLILSFAEQKFFNFNEVLHVNNLFHGLCLWYIILKTSLLYSWSSRFSPTLSSRSFIVLHLTFMSVIHFELIFLKNVRSVSRFTVFLVFLGGVGMWLSLYSAPFVKETILCGEVDGPRVCHTE